MNSKFVIFTNLIRTVNYFKYSKKIKMKRRFCKLSTCRKLLPVDRHGNAETCCNECAWQLKKEREHANYHLLRKTSLSILEANRILKLLAHKFGYGIPIPTEEFHKYNFQWELTTGSFEKDGIDGIAVGDHAYILFTEHKIKIYKNG
jgi:hypothetical protein